MPMLVVYRALYVKGAPGQQLNNLTDDRFTREPASDALASGNRGICVHRGRR